MVQLATQLTPMELLAMQLTLCGANTQTGWIRNKNSYDVQQCCLLKAADVTFKLSALRRRGDQRRKEGSKEARKEMRMERALS